MTDRLTAPGADIADETVAVGCDPLLTSDSRSDVEEAAQEGPVGLRQVSRRLDVAAGHQQDVRRRPRRDVVEGDEEVVRMNASGGDLVSDDPTEEAITGNHGDLLATKELGVRRFRAAS